MKKKDMLKLMLGTLLNAFVFMAFMSFGILVTQTFYGVVMSFLGAMIVIFLILFHFYPIWFKEYTDEFFRLEALKNESKDLQNIDFPD